MLTLTRTVRVYACAAPVDMRKGFDGLSALVEQQLGGQLLKGDVFLFVGRCRRRAKVLYFDGTGLSLLTRDRGRSGTRGRWPVRTRCTTGFCPVAPGPPRSWYSVTTRASSWWMATPPTRR